MLRARRRATRVRTLAPKTGLDHAQLQWRVEWLTDRTSRIVRSARVVVAQVAAGVAW